MTRVNNWPSAMWRCIEDARDVPYRVGSHDCALFALDVVEAITGVDYGEPVRGRYSTEVGSYRTIKRIGGAGLREAVSAILSADPVDRPALRKGDVVLYQDERGDHLGIHTGARAVVLGPDGIAWVPMDQIAEGWRVV